MKLDDSDGALESKSNLLLIRFDRSEPHGTLKRFIWELRQRFPTYRVAVRDDCLPFQYGMVSRAAEFSDEEKLLIVKALQAARRL